MPILGIVFLGIPALFRNRSQLTLEFLVLRQRIAVPPARDLILSWAPIGPNTHRWDVPRMQLLLPMPVAGGSGGAGG
jgi:hypothetical protein